MQGDLDNANRHLGHAYKYVGTIEAGYGLGTQLGVATINLPQEQCLLPHGVYACEIDYRTTIYQGIMNLGKAPTVGRNSLCLEAHLLTSLGTCMARQFLSSLRNLSAKKENSLLERCCLKQFKRT